MTDNHKVKVKWTCPHCGKRNTWKYTSLAEGPSAALYAQLDMPCSCGETTRCRVYQIRLRAVAD